MHTPGDAGSTSNSLVHVRKAQRANDGTNFME
jgi:hypothetical protein